VSITGDGTGATATAALTDGVVTAITVTNGGSGYTTATVAFTGQKWAPATATIDGQEKVLNSSYFKSNTSITRDETGKILLLFEWTPDGAAISQVVTGRLINKPLGIFEGSGEDALPLLGDDGQPIAPTVQAVTTDRGEITGLSFSEATQLSRQLNAGRLPVPLKLIGEKNVDSTLGGDFVKLSVTAGLVGIGAVMLFLMVYYRIPGMVATFSLAFYAILTLPSSNSSPSP